MCLIGLLFLRGNFLADDDFSRRVRVKVISTCYLRLNVNLNNWFGVLRCFKDSTTHSDSRLLKRTRGHVLWLAKPSMINFAPILVLNPRLFFTSFKEFLMNLLSIFKKNQKKSYKIFKITLDSHKNAINEHDKCLLMSTQLLPKCWLYYTKHDEKKFVYNINILQYLATIIEPQHT